MTIYSSTTLAELLDQLDMRAPDLAAPIRERVFDLQDERGDLQQELEDAENTVCCSECQDLEEHVENLEAALADSREQCAKLIAAQESVA